MARITFSYPIHLASAEYVYQVSKTVHTLKILFNIVED